MAVCGDDGHEEWVILFSHWYIYIYLYVLGACTIHIYIYRTSSVYRLHYVQQTRTLNLYVKWIFSRLVAPSNIAAMVFMLNSHCGFEASRILLYISMCLYNDDASFAVAYRVPHTGTRTYTHPKKPRDIHFIIMQNYNENIFP